MRGCYAENKRGVEWGRGKNSISRHEKGDIDGVGESGGEVRKISKLSIV